MFGIIAKLLSSIASFLFPIFASYKALRTSDPAQLTPWLMYWVVLSCCLLVESWTEWILVWIPFYSYIRFFFLLYLVLPQTQGARFLYESQIHPWLQSNESQIDDLITRAHARLRTAGLAYLKQAIELVKIRVLGLPPSEHVAASSTISHAASSDPQSYTQALLARFSIPTARWTASAATSTGSDFYNLLAGAVSSLGASPSSPVTAGSSDLNRSSWRSSNTLIPSDLYDPSDRISFIAAQRARLNMVLGVLDREALELQREETLRPHGDASNPRPSSLALDGEDSASGTGIGNNSSGSGSDDPLPRPPSDLSGFSGLSGRSSLGKSRSEMDFEKIDVDSDGDDQTGLRRRPVGTAGSAAPPSLSAGQPRRAGGGGWLPWGWNPAAPSPDEPADH